MCQGICTVLFCLTAEETEHCCFVWQLKKQNTAILSDSWSIRTICYFVWQLKTQNTVLFFFLTAEETEHCAILSDSWRNRTLLFCLTAEASEHCAIFSDSWRRRRTALCQHCTVLFDWQLKKKNNSTLSTLYCSIWLTAEEEEEQHSVNTVLFYLTDSWRRSTTALCQHCTVWLTAEEEEQQHSVNTVLFYLTDSWRRTALCQHCTVLFDWQLKKKNNSTLSTLYCSIWLTAEEEQHSVNTVLFYLTDSWRRRTTALCQHCTVLFDWQLKKKNNSTLSTLYCSIWLTAEEEQHSVNTVLFYLTDSWRRRTTALCQHCTVLFDWQLKKKYNSTLSTLYCSIWLTAEEEVQQHSVNTVLFYLTDSWRRRTVNTVLFYLTDSWRRRTVNTVLFYLTDSWRRSTTALCQHCTVLFDWQLKKKYNSTLSTLYCSIWLTAEEEVQQHSVNTVLFYLTDSWREQQHSVNTVLFYLTDSWRRSTTAHCQHCTVLFDWQLKKKYNSTLSTLYCSIWLTAEEEVQQHSVNTVLFYLTDSWRRRTALCQHCTVLFDWQLKKKYNSTLSTLYCSIWLTAEEAEQQPVDAQWGAGGHQHGAAAAGGGDGAAGGGAATEAVGPETQGGPHAQGQETRWGQPAPHEGLCVFYVLARPLSVGLRGCRNTPSKRAGSDLDRLGSIGQKRAGWFLPTGLLLDPMHLAKTW